MPWRPTMSSQLLYCDLTPITLRFFLIHIIMLHHITPTHLTATRVQHPLHVSIVIRGAETRGGWGDISPNNLTASPQ